MLEDLIEKPMSGEWGVGEGSINVIRTANFTNSGKINFANIVGRDVPANIVEAKKLQVQDIIIEKSGGSPTQPVGRVVFFEADGLFLCNNFTSILRPIKSVVYPKYLHYILFCNHKFGFVRKHQNKTTGIINLQLPKYVKNTKIPLPSLAEQKQIAEILDAADSLRQKDQQLIEHYTALSQSLFLDMFGDPVTNPMGWKQSNFGAFISILTDYHANGSYEVLKKNVELKREKDYALMVRTTDLEKNNFSEDVIYISRHAYDYLNKSKVFGGEIIVSKIGSAGKVFLMPNLDIPVSLGMNAFLLRFDSRLNNLFTYFLLTSKFGEREIAKRIKGAVTKTIRKDALREICIIVPPIEVQNQFAERIAIIEQQKLQAQANLAKSEDLFNSLLQLAFKGELTGSKAA
jgi:type I restriction enzyme S subunit